MRAASVVTRDVPDCAVAVGNPARVVNAGRREISVNSKKDADVRFALTGQWLKSITFHLPIIDGKETGRMDHHGRRGRSLAAD